MVNLSNELSELSHDELQYVIDGYFLWTYKTMKQRGIKAAFIMYDLVGGRRFFGGIQHFLVKFEGVSKFCRTRGGLRFIWQ